MPEEILNPVLKGKYKVVQTHCPVLLNTTIGDVDLRTITEDQAEQLLASDCPYLEKVKRSTPAA